MVSSAAAEIALKMRHLVVPGQIIATSGEEGGGGFLRGHGTYIEGLAIHRDPTVESSSSSPSKQQKSDDHQKGRDNISMDIDGDDTKHQSNNNNNNSSDSEDDDMMNIPAVDTSKQRLIASVSGVVERVNKLISVIPASPMTYGGQVGDLVVGRIHSVGSSRWKVNIGAGSREAHLPLSGVNLPGGVQRIRTAEDALGMRQYLMEGDLVSAEVQKVMHEDGTLVLHTRSLRYGKLENGSVVENIPPQLIRRMKQHFATLPKHVGVDVLLGKNGYVWIQRTVPKEWQDALSKTQEEAEAPLAETLQKLRMKHASTKVEKEERENISRVRNAVQALALVYCGITPDTIMAVYDKSVSLGVSVKDMLNPDVLVKITAPTRINGE